MGATGRSYGKYGKEEIDNNTFGIGGAVVFKGTPPTGSGIDKPAANKITLKLEGAKGTNVLFQFKLSKDSKIMTITGFRDGIPQVKTKVDVDSGHPSLDKVIATGNSSERQAALKIRNLMQQSRDISENQLTSIANTLIRKKAIRKG